MSLFYTEHVYINTQNVLILWGISQSVEEMYRLDPVNCAND